MHLTCNERICRKVNNYYPFGGVIDEGGRRGADVQNHLYNGKELDRMHGLNLYDYSARQYDAAIGQFTSIDPLCEKYYHISPYAYCAGNPVKYVDPTGCFYGDYFDLYGSYLGCDKLDDHKVYLVTNNDEVKQIKKDSKEAAKSGNTFNIGSVSSAVYIGTEAALKESYSILTKARSDISYNESAFEKRIVNELANVAYSDNTIGERTEGTPTTCKFPILDDSKTLDASIHLHPWENNMKQSDTQPSGIDKESFKNFPMNIIVGAIDIKKVSPNLNTVVNGSAKAKYNYSLGISIYNNNSILIRNIPINTLNNIVKRKK